MYNEVALNPFYLQVKLILSIFPYIYIKPIDNCLIVYLSTTINYQLQFYNIELLTEYMMAFSDLLDSKTAMLPEAEGQRHISV